MITIEVTYIENIILVAIYHLVNKYFGNRYIEWTISLGFLGSVCLLS